jgi:hypothetical protein
VITGTKTTRRNVSVSHNEIKIMNIHFIEGCHVIMPTEKKLINLLAKLATTIQNDILCVFSKIIYSQKGENEVYSYVFFEISNSKKTNQRKWTY